MQFLSDHYKEILAIIGAITAAGLVITVVRITKNKNTHKAIQEDNIVGGDMAGRDINKK